MTAAVCAAAALLSLAAGLAAGHWRAGAGVALGLLVGAANGFLARRALGIEANFGFTAMGRLALLSVIGLALGALLGLPYVPLVLLGIAGAQLVLAVVASVTAVRAS
ncbi:MAG: hypothetical protein E6J41_26715 [Chloroflexi bacterium]|nr:MAG: hypothetical protein E6J41_26715 [Chloroflexota bacterium]